MTTRPRSPNVQIYRPQLTSVLSFSHRVTGLFLSLGAVLLVAWLVCAAAGEEAFAPLQAFIGSWIGLILLFLRTFSLFYHLCNGIRHLFWDGGYGFQLRTIYLSGWSVVIASILLTLLAWIISLAMIG
jgi:succinate dehydrogenase / fumarate reductase cytochrome b subunit